ncbi:hypothetical protein K2X05_11045, partial [bacterium]|nr:hypothetical protein [bacterium]
STNYTNTLQLYVNDVPVASQSFSGSQVQIVNLSVPANYFAPGLNRIKLEPTGSQLISGEYDMVYIDSIDISYYQNWFAVQDQILIMNHQRDTDLVVDGFTNSQLLLYDLSLFGQPEKWTNALTGATADGFAVQFNTPVDPQKGRRIWVSTVSEMLTVSSLELNYGSDLKNTNNQADVIYVGSEELLDAIEPLAYLREQQGFKTKLVSLSAIYNEFGQGLVQHEAIRDFFIYAHTNWSMKPQYFVLLGDGTYDPKAYQNTEIKNRFPVKLMKGAAFNYGSDHWYVTQEDQTIPFAVVGRIPARTSEQMNDYVAKVLAYENGTIKPVRAQMTVLSDQPLYQGEDFDKFSNELVSEIATWNSQMPVEKVSRLSLGNTAFKNKINDSFSNASLVHYMGHGAENMWADNAVFNNNDIDLLNNQQVPVVAAMNCLNAAFYDPGSEGFAEKLVMKKQGGAIAFWGSTSMTPPSVQSVYQKAFYERLMKNSGTKLGDAVKLSKLQANQQSPFTEVMMSWTIIGDPMIQPVIAEKSESSNPPPASSSGGGSSGCSAFAGFKNDSKSLTHWDLVFALLLESMVAWICIRKLRRILR